MGLLVFPHSYLSLLILSFYTLSSVETAVCFVSYYIFPIKIFSSSGNNPENSRDIKEKNMYWTAYFIDVNSVKQEKTGPMGFMHAICNDFQFKELSD